MTLTRRPVVIAALAREVATRFGAAASESGLTIHLGPLREDAQAEVDRVRLEQVLSNLVSNAVKYAPEGSTIAVEVGVSEAPEGWVVIGVHNDGESIPPGALATIFDRFGTTPPVRAGRHASGLGLAICRRITEAHGGSIVAESVAGRTSFWVALPVGQGTGTEAIKLTVPIGVAAPNAYDRMGLLASLAHAGLPVQFVSPSCADPAAGAAPPLAITTDAGGNELGPCLRLERRTRADVQALGEALVSLARHAAPRLLLARPPGPILGATLSALGVQIDVNAAAAGARDLPEGSDVDVIQALAADIAGAAGVGAVLAFLRRNRAAGSEAALTVVIDHWDGFVAAYGGQRAAQLRDSLLHEIPEAARGPAGPDVVVTPAGDGFVGVGSGYALEGAARELPHRFEALVRLHCRKEDREHGYIAIGSRQVPLPTLLARVLPLAVAEDEVLAALRMAP